MSTNKTKKGKKGKKGKKESMKERVESTLRRMWIEEYGEDPGPGLGGWTYRFLPIDQVSSGDLLALDERGEISFYPVGRVERDNDLTYRAISVYHEDGGLLRQALEDRKVDVLTRGCRYVSQ